MSRITPSSKNIVRNYQHHPRTSRMGGSWHTYNHAREQKFDKQVKNHISWWVLMSKKTPSSETPVRNIQCPPSMTLRMGVLDTHLFILESWNLAHKSRIIYQDDLWCQGWPHPPRFLSGTINILQVWLRGWGVLGQLIFMQKFGTQVKKHISCWFLMPRKTPFSDSPIKMP